MGGVEHATVACAPAPKNGGRIFTSSISPCSALYLSLWGRSSQSWLPFSCMKLVMAVRRPSPDGIGPTKELRLRYRGICMLASAPSSVGISPDRWLGLIGASRGDTRQRRWQNRQGRGVVRRCAAARRPPSPLAPKVSGVPLVGEMAVASPHAGEGRLRQNRGSWQGTTGSMVAARGAPTQGEWLLPVPLVLTCARVSSDLTFRYLPVFRLVCCHHQRATSRKAIINVTMRQSRAWRPGR